MISRIYSRFCQTLPAPEGSRGLLAAFSGGLDSTVLLDARNSTTGRGIPIKVQRGSPIHLTLTVNVDNEFTAGQALSVCFSLFR